MENVWIVGDTVVVASELGFHASSAVVFNIRTKLCLKVPKEFIKNSDDMSGQSSQDCII